MSKASAKQICADIIMTEKHLHRWPAGSPGVEANINDARMISSRVFSTLFVFEKVTTQDYHDVTDQWFGYLDSLASQSIQSMQIAAISVRIANGII